MKLICQIIPIVTFLLLTSCKNEDIRAWNGTFEGMVTGQIIEPVIVDIVTNEVRFDTTFFEESISIKLSMDEEKVLTEISTSFSHLNVNPLARTYTKLEGADCIIGDECILLSGFDPYISERSNLGLDLETRQLTMNRYRTEPNGYRLRMEFMGTEVSE